jgi:hypothetical protein
VVDDVGVSRLGLRTLLFQIRCLLASTRLGAEALGYTRTQPPLPPPPPPSPPPPQAPASTHGKSTFLRSLPLSLVASSGLDSCAHPPPHVLHCHLLCPFSLFRGLGFRVSTTSRAPAPHCASFHPQLPPCMGACVVRVCVMKIRVGDVDTRERE